MATTRNIVNNLENQTIEGSLTITGTFSTNYGIYRALLTDTEPTSGNEILDFLGGLIIGETYTIGTYSSGDDFSNIAELISGTMNTSGCVFRATGEVPADWTNDSILDSSGDIVVQVLENTLGFDIVWSGYAGPGAYVGFNSITGPQTNAFPRKSTQVSVSQNGGPFTSPWIIKQGGVGGLAYKDDAVYLYTWDMDNQIAIEDSLYYQPIEIKIKRDQDTTPVTIYGLNLSGYPYSSVVVELLGSPQNISGSGVGIFSADSNVTVNDINELVDLLNSDTNTNYLGTFAIDPEGEEGLILTMPQYLKNQFSPDDVLTFEVYAD